MSTDSRPSIHVRVNPNNTFSVKIDPEAQFALADLDRASAMLANLSTAAKLVSILGLDLFSLYEQFTNKNLKRPN
jgi:hypothetical protein